MIPGIAAAQMRIGGASVLERLIFPLTYDEQDLDGLLTWSRTGSAPHVTPEGFEGMGTVLATRVRGCPIGWELMAR